MTLREACALWTADVPGISSLLPACTTSSAPSQEKRLPDEGEEETPAACRDRRAPHGTSTDTAAACEAELAPEGPHACSEGREQAQDEWGRGADAVGGVADALHEHVVSAMTAVIKVRFL